MNTETLPAAEPVAALTQHQIKVLLVDDQAMVGEAVRRMLLAAPDITLHFCIDPAQAVAKAEQIKPTLILQDLVMPGIDGLTMVRTFRANPLTQDVPLIVLSSKEEPKTKAEAFALGANDYLVKLPDKIELIARIRYHSTAYINLLQRNEAFAALVQSQQLLAAELAEAAEYVRSLLPPPLQGDITTAWQFITSTSLGGDSFGYHWIDDEHFAMYLLDVCGHGVGAALLSVSAMNVITARTLPNVDFRQPDQVLSALNETFPMEKQNNMFFTIWYGVFQKSTRQLTYSSAGHPPAVLIRDNAPHSPEVKTFFTPGMVIGAFPESKFKVAAAEIPPQTRLYLLSDGTYELRRPDKPMMTFDEFTAILSLPAPAGVRKIDAVFNEVRRQHGQDGFDDDYSLVEFCIA
jgi:phosphoserine phosphatase RsbU/P